MGCRVGRASSGEEELAASKGGSSRHSSAHKRRTAPWFWCGVAFLTIFTGCTTADNQTSPPRTVLRIGFPEGSVSASEIGARVLTNLITLEGLTQLSVDGRAVPWLAESWSWENEGLTLRLKLRRGVRFHDGSLLTPELAATLLREAIARASNRALFPATNDIATIRPGADHQLLIDLARRSAMLPEELDIPLGIRREFETVGTGAYHVVERRADEIVLEAFADYYQGVPDINRIEISPFDTIRAAWVSLLRQDVDMVTDVPPEAVPFVQTDDVQVLSFARPYQFLVAFNSARAPFTSTAVRRALNAAVDRETLIRKVLHGEGDPSSGPLWPKHWAYDSSVAPYTYDPGLAATLLEEAGFRMPDTDVSSRRQAPARLRFTCLIPENFNLLERIGLEVQKQLYDVAVDMQFEVVPISEYDARIREGRFEAVLVDMISGPTLGRPFIFWRSARQQFNGLNVFGYENAEAERIFQLLRNSINEAAVRSATARLQRVVLDDPPALFLAWNERARAVRRHFHVDETGRDPLLSIRRWTENTDRQVASVQ